MSLRRKYSVEVVFEIRREYGFCAESESDAKSMAVSEFRDWFIEAYDTAPSTSELDVYVEEVT